MARQIKVELPADPTADYEPPADASLDDLRALEAAAREAGNAALEAATTAEEVQAAERYITAVESIKARSTQIKAEQQAHQDRVNEARNRLAATEGDGEDADAQAAEGEGDTQPANHVEDDAEGDGGGEAPVEVSDPGAVGAEPALVASNDGNGRTTLRPGGQMPGRRSAVAAAASAAPRPVLPPSADRDRGEAAFLTAGAGIKGFDSGEQVDWDRMGVAAERQFSRLPKGRPGRGGGPQVSLSIGAANIQTHDNQLVASAKPNEEYAGADEAIEWAVSNHRLSKETGESSLVAAGGWCAPSETLYDLLDLTTDDGLLDVPGITVTRGGVRYSLGPDFTAVYSTSNANFTRTEAQAIAGTPTKPMVNIPCPTFTDNRMVVDGLYLTGDILTSKGYPEAYADYTRKAMKAFAHYVNAQSIADIVGVAGSVIDLSTSTGTAPASNRSNSATVEILGALELQITDMRYKNRLAMNQAVEVIAPFWLRGNIRSDLAKRQGWTNPFDVTDDDIRAWFADRGATVQFVYDWQDAFTGVSGGFGAATAIGGWPLTANILLYPQGGIVRALEPVIELSAVYDSTLLQTNQFVSLFMEQGRLTLKRAWDVRNIKLSVPPYGSTTGGAAINGASGSPQLAGNVV